MTRKTFEAAVDCTTKIRNLTPEKEKIMEMFSFLSMVNRLSEICMHEGLSGLMVEADNLPESTVCEKAFKKSIKMWLDGAGIDEAVDHAADLYFEENPSGYDAAIFFAAIFSVSNILADEHSYGFIDQALQFLLPDGWRWREEDEKEAAAHKDDEHWFASLHSHRKKFLGDPLEETQHRFDNIKICNLITLKDNVAKETGLRIAKRLPDFKDGALQLIMKELIYTDLEYSLYALPESAEDRIISNIDPYSIPKLKGHCILNKERYYQSGRDPGDT